MRSNWLALVIRMLLGVVLALSGWAHLQNDLMYYADVRQYQILNASGSFLASKLLPWLQICLACCFFMDLLAKGSSVVCCCLFLVFSLAQATILLSGRSIDCGCFGVLHSETISFTTISFALALFCIAVLNCYTTFLTMNQDLR